MKRKTSGVRIIFSLVFISACLAGCSKFETLKVVSCYPGNGQYGVSEDAVLSIEFNNAVNRSDIDKYFSVSGDSGSVEGTVEWYSSEGFNYVPLSDMSVGSRYVISIPREVRDNDGNRMEQDFISEFYVGDDINRPVIISSIPAYTEGGTADIPADLEYLSVVFSEPMDRLVTEDSFSISPYVSGYFSWNDDSTEMRYILTDVLDYGSQYKMSVSGSAGDSSGNVLGDQYSVIFITGDDFDFPVVTGIFDPASGPVYWDTQNTNNNISKFISISVQFSEPMQRAACESAFEMMPAVDGLFSWNADSTIMTFTPKDALKSEALYVVKTDTTAKDMNGWNLQQEYQVRIFTDSSDSLFIRVGNVSGTHDVTGSFSDLFSEAPAVWPVPVDMGPLAAPDGNSGNYKFCIQFINDNGVVEFSPYSLIDNILYEGFGNDYDPTLADLSWNSLHTELYIELSNLSNALYTGSPHVLYRMTILGGESGIMDVNDNIMMQNFSFEFSEP